MSLTVLALPLRIRRNLLCGNPSWDSEGFPLKILEKAFSGFYENSFQDYGRVSLLDLKKYFSGFLENPLRMPGRLFLGTLRKSFLAFLGL